MKRFAAILLLLAAPAAAHDVMTADGRAVSYQGLTTPQGSSSCCDDRDCSPVEWRETPGGVLEVCIGEYVDGECRGAVGTSGWQKIPARAMMPRPHEDAPDLAHACFPRTGLPHPYIRCVWPPGMPG